MTPIQLTSSQWEQFDRDGFVRLGRTLDDNELAALQDRIDSIMLGEAPVDYDQLYMQLDTADGQYSSLAWGGNGWKGKTLAYRKIQNLEHDDLFLDYMVTPIFESICRRLYGEDVPIGCYRAMFMNKPAHQGTLLPWHQDAWNSLDRQPLVTTWTALDPATIANGCVEVVPGTHKLGLVNPEHASGFMDEVQIAKYCNGTSNEFVELEAGESVLLHNWLMHRSDVNRTDTARRAFSVCYLDANTIDTNGTKFPPLKFPTPVG